MAKCKECVYEPMCYKIEHFGRDLETDEACKHFRDVAKMVPQAPILSWTGNEYETQCPTCHGILDEGLHLEYRQYCSKCGQALDWSEANGH